MKNIVVALCGILCFVGCSSKPTAPSIQPVQAPVVLNDTIITEDAPSNEPPEFRRIYTVKIDYETTLRVTIYYRWWLYQHDPDIESNSELSQKDGKWVSFDKDNIADKILRPELVPEIEKYCSQISEMDATYRASDKNEFTDYRGVTWQKVKQVKVEDGY